MQAHDIKAFIDAMAASDLAEMVASKDGWTLRLVRRHSSPEATDAIGVARSTLGASTREAGAVAEFTDAADAAPGAKLQCAPLSGLVFLQPAPDQPPFVVPGQGVKAGQTLCLIEAMKVFNEVQADQDGTVDAILVSSGQDVDVGQGLVRLR
jgi:acetyl-CoA carboxylase biotin carboxyl carrier protein